MSNSIAKWRRRTVPGTAAVVGVALACAAAFGQPGGGGARRVDEGFADLTPFSLSFRVMELDLRKPIGFEHVYELAPGQEAVARAPWATGTGHRFARQSGALTVVFPYSQYVPTKRGNAAVVPADSRFIIGALPAPASPQADLRRPALNAVVSAAAGGVDRRADRSTAGVRVAGTGGAGGAGGAGVGRNAESVEPAPTAGPAEGMLTSEGYRQRRVRALLDEVARASGAGSAREEEVRR